MKVNIFVNISRVKPPIVPALSAVWFVLVLALSSCAGNEPQQINIAFYNCENLFDTVDDSRFDDEDFTPNGTYRYTGQLYRNRLHNIATVLAGMDAVMVGLAEIENATVLTDLCHQPEMKDDAWEFLQVPGYYHRGLNVALLYRASAFYPLSARSLAVPGIERGATRDILYVTGILYGDTVHVLVNHWPSRRGGDAASQVHRMSAAELCAATVKELRAGNPNARILVMGDFNDNPTDISMTTLGAGTMALANRVGLYNPFVAQYKSGKGTEAYQQQWNLFDQILVSPAFLAPGGWQFSKASVYAPSFMRIGKNGYPRRAFLGTRWANGYSDHFPVMISLQR